MISVSEALDLVSQNCKPTNSFEKLALANAKGCVLSKDVISPIDMPPFRQSAMDGYALRFQNSSSYKVIGEIKAGDNHHPTLLEGEAVRIFTGAAVPDSANAVVMQEKVNLSDDFAIIESTVRQNENIRPMGEQITSGEIALTKGTKLGPGAIGYLSSLGITEVSVYKKPSISIVVTGNELARPGDDLEYGQIYESNGLMLASALESLGYGSIDIYKVEDNYEKTTKTLDDAISDADLTIISGGISVGDYDFVGKALEDLKVQQLFYKVKQKPGKPLFFGKKGNKIVFALPGNPAAALSCFYVYVNTALQKISGSTNFAISRIKAISESNYERRGDRPQFLKAIFNDGKVEILEGQSSAMLHTFALSNAMIYVPETTNTINKNDEVEVILLPVN